MLRLDKIVERCLELGASYADAILVHETWRALAVRSFSADISVESRGPLLTVRALVSGCWGVASAHVRDGCDPLGLAARAVKLARVAAFASKVRIRGVAEVAPANAVLRDVAEEPNEDDVMEILTNMVSELDAPEVRGAELIFETGVVSRWIRTSDGVEVREERRLSMITAYVAHERGQISGALGWQGGARALEGELCKCWLERIKVRARQAARWRMLNPLARGTRFTMILSPEVAGALVHECVGHMLQADRLMLAGAKMLPKGVEIASEDVSVSDDPAIPGGFGSYRFDDEGVAGVRKTLVDHGMLVGYLHNRASAAFFREEPTGNGRGLTNVARSIQSNLVLHPGDWREDELVEETRRGLLLRGLIFGRIDEAGNLVLEVEDAVYIENGEPKAVIAGPLRAAAPAARALRGIDAVCRRLEPRAAFEKGVPVCEFAPMIRVHGLRVL